MSEPELAGDIIDRVLPYRPTPLEDHLAWVRKSIALIDAWAISAPASELIAIGRLRESIVDFGSDVEELINAGR